MKNLIIPMCAALFVLFGTTATKAQETAKGLIINTSSQAEVDKILKTLKGQDPSTYRLTVTNTSSAGRKSSKTYGTASIGDIKKIDGSLGTKAGGGLAANDIVILVKNIVRGKNIQDAVISQLNTSMTKQAMKTVQINANKSVKVLN